MKYIKVFENFGNKFNKKEIKENFFNLFKLNTTLYLMDTESNLYEIKFKDIEFTNEKILLVFLTENGSKIYIDSINIEDKYLDEISLLDCSLTEDSSKILSDMLKLLNSYIK